MRYGDFHLARGHVQQVAQHRLVLTVLGVEQ